LAWSRNSPSPAPISRIALVFSGKRSAKKGASAAQIAFFFSSSCASKRRE
jgi:hypothetical protein